MRNAIFTLLLIMLMAVGCAHRTSTGNSSLITAETLTAGQAVDAESSDDEEDFLDEDFLDDDEFGDATADETAAVADPLYHWNKAMFHFNDRLYYNLLKPLAEGYRAATPSFFRNGMKNFLENLATPVRVVNCVLQGKSEAAGNEISRFMVNSTVGILGFGDPAKNKYDIPRADEDFGQTLGVYGVGEGIYIVWPFLGPSTLRDSIGYGGDYFLVPINHLDLETGESVGLTVFETVNNVSFRLGDYESLKDAAIDPYDAFRDFYIQYRSKKIKE